MKEFIEKQIERLEELSIPIYDSDGEIENKVVFTDIAKNIKGLYGVPTLAHLTCVSSTKQTVREKIDEIVIGALN